MIIIPEIKTDYTSGATPMYKIETSAHGLKRQAEAWGGMYVFSCEAFKDQCDRAIQAFGINSARIYINGHQFWPLEDES